MKIEAGTLRGKRFHTPANMNTRPALSRIRTVLFDTLSRDLPESVCLDLFGGSGAFSFEAISRGAKEVHVIELDHDAYEIITANSAALQLHDAIHAYQADALAQIPRFSASGMRFDIILAAPPFYEKLYRPLLEALTASPLFTEGGILVVHSDRRQEPLAGHERDWRVIKEKRKGTSKLLFCRPVYRDKVGV